MPPITTRMSRFLVPIVVAIALVPGAAGSDPATGRSVDGIRCERSESGVFHIHQHLSIYDHGKPIAIPSDVGRPLGAACLYWVHTHTPDGLIHIESPQFRSFRLGEFFDIWGQPLSATRVGPARITPGQLRAYVDGNLYQGSPRKIDLVAHSDIVLEAGPPYKKPAPFTDWQGQ